MLIQKDIERSVSRSILGGPKKYQTAFKKGERDLIQRNKKLLKNTQVLKLEAKKFD